MPAVAVPPEVGTAAPAGRLRFPGPADTDGRPRPPGDGGRAGGRRLRAQVSVIAVTIRSAARCRRCRGGSKTYHGLPADLFDGQAIPQGGWVMPGGGWMCRLTRYHKAWYGWVSLGSRGHWPPTRLPDGPPRPPHEHRRNAAARRRPLAHRGSRRPSRYRRSGTAGQHSRCLWFHAHWSGAHLLQPDRDPARCRSFDSMATSAAPADHARSSGHRTRR